jgi:uncharacterized protein (TIGR02266 family)
MKYEQRRFGRHPCRLRVHFSSARQLKDHYITDIGAGGVFVETLYPLDIGTPVDLEVFIGDGPDPFRIHGQVIWIRNLSQNRPSGMGIRFGDIPLETRKHLERVIKSAQ